VVRAEVVLGGRRMSRPLLTHRRYRFPIASQSPGKQTIYPEQGSIPVIERFILTPKSLSTRVIMVPLRREKMREGLGRVPRLVQRITTLRDATPDEVYHGRHPTSRYPRLEPRAHWPRGAPCANPRVPIRGCSGQPLDLDVEFHAGRKHLPIVTLRRAA
jgi:hypothetical protein